MYRSMYDILNKSIDYDNEYDKLFNMMMTGKYYKDRIKSYTLIEIFDILIPVWKYKGTKCSAQEILEELEIDEYYSESVEEILKLCDFIINIREFVYFEKCKKDNEIKSVVEYNRHCIEEEKISVPIGLYINDKLMNDLVYEILNSLNYEVIKQEDYKCFIVKKNVDAEETAKVVEDENIANKILQYNDYTIVDNKEAKKSILKSLADYFEGKKSEIIACNAELEKNISFALNNFNIRHNNITGVNANELIKNIEDNELIKLYDKTYYLMLIAFRLIELKELESDIIKIRKNFKK